MFVLLVYNYFQVNPEKKYSPRYEEKKKWNIVYSPDFLRALDLILN